MLGHPAELIVPDYPAPARRKPAPAPLPPEAVRPDGGLGFSAYGLQRSFGAKRVLEALNLVVPAGQFLAIVGRSGCGKSTLLRLLAGLDQPDSGLIGFGKEDRPRQPGDVRVMFQEPRLLPWLSILDNVIVGLGDGHPAGDAEARAREALAAVGLADRAPEWPSVLSGGQRQRVALARALVSRPGILALDEPLGALDALTRIDMQALLETVWQQAGLTALMVTHDVPEAVALADRVVLIDEGRITLDLTVDLPRPRRRGTPEFAALESRILDRILQRHGG